MKKILNLTGKLAVLMLMLSLTGCYYDEVIEIAPLPPDFEASYATDIQPIFNQNCVACHGGNIAPDLRSGSSYTALTNGGYVIPFDAVNSILYKSLKGEGAPLMPPSGALPNANIDLVKNWIDDGALNN